MNFVAWPWGREAKELSIIKIIIEQTSGIGGE